MTSAAPTSVRAALAERLLVGTSGWSYDFWTGSFYPPGTPARDYLRLYSSVFDVVEVDSSFYRIPLPSMVATWRRATPEDFAFTAKFPRGITHERKLRGVEGPLEQFYGAFDELGPKLRAFVVQFPPSFQVEKDLSALETFLTLIRTDVPHAFEFRHRSWFQEKVSDLLASHHVAQAWSTTQYLDSPPTVTSDLLYLRLIGDRSLEQLGELQKDRTEEMGVWGTRIRDAIPDVRQAYVFFNNHFAGFGPGSVNEFHRLVGLIERAFPRSGQKTLTEF
ncbi:MAG: DUF72 domain-containing protein [Thermoplasmata archaeon]